MIEKLICYGLGRAMVPEIGHTTTDLTVKFKASGSVFPVPYNLSIKEGTLVKELAQDDFVVEDLSGVEWVGNGQIKNWSILLSDASIYGIRVPRSCVLTEREITKKRANLESYIAMTRDHLREANDRDELSALEFMLEEALGELEDLC